MTYKGAKGSVATFQPNATANKAINGSTWSSFAHNTFCIMDPVSILYFARCPSLANGFQRRTLLQYMISDTTIPRPSEPSQDPS